MKISVICEMDDGKTYIGAADARDIRRWESTYKTSFIGLEMSMTAITQLAYLALRRQHVVGDEYPTYEAFDDQCVTVSGTTTPDREESAVIADPTQPEATDVSSVS